MAEARTTPGITAALTIAGSDSSGGAGIEADLKTFTVMNVFGACAITAITAQNTVGVRASKILDAELVEQQIDAVADDINLAAAKTGMLGNAANIEIVAAAVKRHKLFPLVVDPVMVAKNGASLIDEDAVAVLIRELLPQATIVTPNRHEAAKILGSRDAIDSIKAATAAAREVCKQTGAAACLLKGFKRENDKEGEAVDLFYDGTDVHEVASDWRATKHTHGAGCVLSAAIAAALAHGRPLDEAVTEAKGVVSEAIRQTSGLGNGTGPVNSLAYMNVKK